MPTGGGKGNHRNITEPYGGSSKFFRDTTKIFQRPPRPPNIFITFVLEYQTNRNIISDVTWLITSLN